MYNTLTIKRITYDGVTYRPLQQYQKRQIRLLSFLSGIDYSFIVEALEQSPSVPFEYKLTNNN